MLCQLEYLLFWCMRKREAVEKILENPFVLTPNVGIICMSDENKRKDAYWVWHEGDTDLKKPSYFLKWLLEITISDLTRLGAWGRHITCPVSQQCLRAWVHSHHQRVAEFFFFSFFFSDYLKKIKYTIAVWTVSGPDVTLRVQQILETSYTAQCLMEVQGSRQPTWSWECFQVYLYDYAAEAAIIADLHDYIHIDPKKRWRDDSRINLYGFETAAFIIL